jgi:hypothetical protein
MIFVGEKKALSAAAGGTRKTLQDQLGEEYDVPFK